MQAADTSAPLKSPYPTTGPVRSRDLLSKTKRHPASAASFLFKIAQSEGIRHNYI